MAGWKEPEHRLDAERLRDLFVSLDSQIGLRRDTAALGKLDFLICGGAVMCFQVSSRATGDVDIMHPPLNGDALEAVRTVARRRGIAPQWFNDGPARFARYGMHVASRLLFEGDHTRFWAPDNAYLLGMKVHAARAEDIDDAVWLMRDTGTTAAEEMNACAQTVSESIGSSWVPTSTHEAFMDQCVHELNRRDSAPPAAVDNPVADPTAKISFLSRLRTGWQRRRGRRNRRDSASCSKPPQQ